METRTTANPGPPSTTTLDTPMCTCCKPAQPLMPPDTGQTEYECPVTGQKYVFDPAEGVARQVAVTRQTQTIETSVPNRVEDLFPRSPEREEIRTVNPEEPFAQDKVGEGCC